MANTEKLSNDKLAQKVADRLGMTKKDVHAVLDASIEEMSDALERGERVGLHGFGSFEVRHRKSRVGVKPGTTEKINIPAKRYVGFRAGKKLIDAMED